jgi:zinc protease
MQVMTVLHHEQPAVTMHLLVRAGAAQDPPGKDGVAYLAAQLLDQGTATRTANQIADQIDSIGGSMGTSAQQDRTIASAVVMKDSFDLGLNLLSDVVRNPAFDPAEIERQKEQVVSLLKVSSEDPDYIASAVFDRIVYGSHPYGQPGSGTPQTIAGITREDLREFHRRHFVANNAILAIVGDVTRDEAFAAAERVFGSWTRADVPSSQSAEPPQSARRVVVIDKPDAVQTEIRAGQIAIPRKHSDYLAWDLAVRILGGEGANRLHRVLRSERGLTYGASASTDAKKLAGSFVAETDTRTEATAEVLRLIREEMVRLQTRRVDVRELGDAQAYLSGSFPLTIETPNDIAVQVLNVVFFELPLTDIGTFHKRVVAVTPDDVQRVAKQYIRPDSLTIVLVGNARAFVPQLREMGLAFDVIPIEEVDLTSPTLSRERRRVNREVPDVVPVPIARQGEPLRLVRTGLQQSAPARPPSPTPASPTAPRTPTGTAQVPRAKAAPADAAAAQLLRQVIDARGGLAALKAVRTIVAEADTSFVGEKGEVAATVRVKTYVLYPDRFRVDAMIQNDVISQIYNAGRMWEKSPAGVREMPPELRNDAAAGLRRDTVPLLIGAAEGRLTVQAVVDGGQHVLEITAPGGERVRMFVGDKMQIAKQQVATPVPGGRQVLQEESFTDYRLVGNVRVPFQAAVSRNGQVIAKRSLTRIVFNEAVDPSLFNMPEADPPAPDTSKPSSGR